MSDIPSPAMSAPELLLQLGLLAAQVELGDRLGGIEKSLDAGIRVATID
jgi:hypothetical protein